jgi:hypothetical protein
MPVDKREGILMITEVGSKRMIDIYLSFEERKTEITCPKFNNSLNSIVKKYLKFCYLFKKIIHTYITIYHYN